MRKIAEILVVTCLALLAGRGPLWSQAPAAEPKSTPAMKETGEPEGDAFHFPPIPVDQRVYQLNDAKLSKLARKIEDGSANMIERRAWWWLEQRLMPFDKPIPDNWQFKAQAVIKAMEKDRAESAGPSPEAGTTYTWRPIGPFVSDDGSGDKVSGRATAIWVDPTNANFIILGTADGGVWKTTDKGTTWNSIFDSAASLSIGSLTVDPNNKQVIYVGTSEGNNNGDWIGGVGMYKSINGGSVWTLLTLPSWYYTQPWHSIRRIAVDPRNSNNVYAAIDGGLIYSTTGGTSWTLNNLGTAGAIGTDVVLDSTTNPTTIFVAVGADWSSTANGVYRATAGAGPWTTIGSATYGNGFPAANIGRIALLLAPSDLKQMYVLIESLATSGSLGIFYAADITATPVTWVAKSATNFCSAQCWYDMTGAVNPTDPTRLIVGGLDDYISSNTGGTLTQVSYWSSSGSNFSHADHHHMVMPDATTVYDANDGGFFIGTINWTTPASTTWVNKNSGIGTLQFYGFSQLADGSRIQGGLQDNGNFYWNGSTWTEVYGGDGGASAWDPSSTQYGYEEYVYSQISRSSTMTTTTSPWTCLNFGGCSCGNPGCDPDSSTAFIAPFTLDANQPNTMYAASKYIYANTAVRTGTTWTKQSVTDLTGGVSGYVTAIHSALNSGGASGTGYIGTSNGKAWYFSSSGTTLADVSTGLSGATVTSFTTDPTNGLRVLVTVSGYGAPHVYRSTTGSTSGTWTNITGALPAVPFNTIILDPADVNHAYVGSDFGIYENTAVWGAGTWSSLTNNLPAVSVQQLLYASGGKLRAATHGRGIWEMIKSIIATPKEDSPSKNMTAAKGSGTTINVTFTNGCGALDNTVYTGSLSTLQGSGVSWTNRYCNRGSSSPASFDPGAATNLYFVIVGNNTDGIEGSYGQATGGTERPVAGFASSCYYGQNLTGACP